MSQKRDPRKFGVDYGTRPDDPNAGLLGQFVIVKWGTDRHGRIINLVRQYQKNKKTGLVELVDIEIQTPIEQLCPSDGGRYEARGGVRKIS